MGMKYLRILLVTFVSSSFLNAGTQVEAEAIVREHKSAMTAWRNELATAQSVEMMNLIVAKKPNVQDYKSRMIKVVGAELKTPWTLKYSGWLLSNTTLGPADTKFIMDYAGRFHMNTPDLGSFCYNVAISNQKVMEKKIFIEKAYKTIINPKQKGIAAISLAIVLSEMGDVAVNNARRLTLVKESIISSADERVGDETVGEVAMEMVHRIKNLSKGCVAPDILGVDSSGASVSLSQYKGKVVMLVFWSSFDLPVDQTVDLLTLMRNIEKQYLGKNFALIGVNKDQVVNLRELEKAGQTSSKNISDPQHRIFNQYRVGSPPFSYVIDQEGKIRFNGVVGSFATLTVDALLNPAPAK